jgi:polyvinyl alcohol dehydrogenase (cytochrome)
MPNNPKRRNFHLFALLLVPLLFATKVFAESEVVATIPVVTPSMDTLSIFFEPADIDVYRELISPLCLPDNPVVRISFVNYPELLNGQEVLIHLRGTFEGKEYWYDVGTLAEATWESPLFGPFVLLNALAINKMPVSQLRFDKNAWTGDIRARVNNTTGRWSNETILDFDYNADDSKPNLPAHVQRFYDDPGAANYIDWIMLDHDERGVQTLKLWNPPSRWSRLTKETGTVRVRFKKPEHPLPSFDDRWMKLLPSSDFRTHAAVYNWRRNLTVHDMQMAKGGEAHCRVACTAQLDTQSLILSNGFRFDIKNTGESASSIIDSGNVNDLQVEHVFVDALETERRGTAAVTEQAIYLTSGPNLQAIDRHEGCFYWHHRNPGLVLPGHLDKLSHKFRSTSVFLVDEPTLNKRLVITGTQYGQVLAFDAGTGEKVWEQQLEADAPFMAQITGGLQYHDGQLFVPVSSKEILLSAAESVCCFSKGKVVSLDSATGAVNWEFVTVSEETELQKNGLFGNNGASVWTTPVIDVAREQLYVGVAQNYTKPVTQYANSVVALNINNGHPVWSFKGADPRIQGDTFNGSCAIDYPLNLNCDGIVYYPPDYIESPRNPYDTEVTVYDFDMATASLATTSDGRDILVAPSKSGAVFGLDPSSGEMIWVNQVGEGAAVGGVHWGLAVDGKRAYVSTVDLVSKKALFVLDLEEMWKLLKGYIGVPAEVTPDGRPGVYAIDLDTGATVWESHPKSFQRLPESEEIVLADTIFSAPVTLSNDLVFAASLNGILHAFDKNTGENVWVFDTDTATTSPGGQPGHGGTIDSVGPVLADDMLIVNSGYYFFGGTNRYQAGPGNSTFVLKLK